MNVLITGGSSGLGEAITRLIASKPEFKIYFTFSNSKDNALHLEEKFSNITSIKCDFKIEDEVNQLIESLPQLDIDVLINNAYSGQFLDSYFHKTSKNDFLDSFKDNIIPTIKITQASISIFRKKKFGKVITILTAALVSNPPIGSSVYVANKAYLMQLSKVWATENVKFNISANTISPAFMQTKFTESIDDRIVEQILASNPLKRLLTTNEVAESVLFLINSSQHINGVDLLLNSGVNLK